MKSIKEQSLVNQQHNDKFKLNNGDDSNTLMKAKQCLGRIHENDNLTTCNDHMKHTLCSH